MTSLRAVQVYGYNHKPVECNLTTWPFSNKSTLFHEAVDFPRHGLLSKISVTGMKFSIVSQTPVQSEST